MNISSAQFQNAFVLYTNAEVFAAGRARALVNQYELANPEDENLGAMDAEVLHVGNCVIRRRYMMEVSRRTESDQRRFFRASVISTPFGNAYALDMKYGANGHWRPYYSTLPKSGLSVYEYKGYLYFKTFNANGYAPVTNFYNWKSIFQNEPGVELRLGGEAAVRSAYNDAVGLNNSGNNTEREWSFRTKIMTYPIYRALRQEWTMHHIIAKLLADRNAFWYVSEGNMKNAQLIFDEGVKIGEFIAGGGDLTQKPRRMTAAIRLNATRLPVKPQEPAQAPVYEDDERDIAPAAVPWLERALAAKWSQDQLNIAAMAVEKLSLAQQEQFAAGMEVLGEKMFKKASPMYRQMYVVIRSRQ